IRTTERQSKSISRPAASAELAELDEPLLRGDDRPGCEAEEEPVLDHARNGDELAGERLRLLDALQRGIEDVVPAIGDEWVAVRPPSQRQRRRGPAPGENLRDGLLRGAQAEGIDLD